MLHSVCTKIDFFFPWSLRVIAYRFAFTQVGLACACGRVMGQHLRERETGRVGKLERQLSFGYPRGKEAASSVPANGEWAMKLPGFGDTVPMRVRAKEDLLVLVLKGFGRKVVSHGLIEPKGVDGAVCAPKGGSRVGTEVVLHDTCATGFVV